MRTHSPGPEKDAGADSPETWRLPFQGCAILSRSPKCRSGQAKAAGKGRGQAEAAPHGRTAGLGLAHWLGWPGVWIAPAAAALPGLLSPLRPRGF